VADAAAATGTASVMATEAEREGGGKRETSSENIGITKINMNISGARRWLNHRPHVACPRADVACPRADVACPRAALDSAVRESEKDRDLVAGSRCGAAEVMRGRSGGERT
jgi:hypothetical protein